jgi:hypothetical protein
MPETKLAQIPRSAADLSRLPVQIGAASLPSNRTIQALAQDVLNSFKYAFTVAAAEAPISQPGPVDKMFREFLDSRSQGVRSTHKAKASALIHAPSALREHTLGRYGRVEVADYAKVGHGGLVSLLGKLEIDSKQLQEAVEKLPNSALRLSLPGIVLRPPSEVKSGSGSGKIKLEIPPNLQLRRRTMSKAPNLPN